MNLVETSMKYGVLHNRKTGGTVLKEMIDQQKYRTPDMNARFFGHAMTFPRFIKEYPALNAVFFIREPLSRFVSGFYSRQRQGLPRYHFPWSRAEARAFKRFTTPNHLAEALTDSGFFERRAAVSAMKSIRHVRHTYLEFLGKPEFLEKHANRIDFIGHQTEFNADLARLCLLLGIDSDIEIPSDDIRSHRTPGDLDRHLSKRAIANLESWYGEDYEIYEWCLNKRKKLINELNQKYVAARPNLINAVI